MVFTQHPASVVNTLLNKPTHTSKGTVYLSPPPPPPQTSASLILVRVSFRLDFMCSRLTVSILMLMHWFAC